MNILETFAEAAQARLVTAGLCGGDVALHRDPPTEDTELPIASVTYGNDSGTADGDSRTGTSDFVHTMQLVIDILDTAPTGAELMAKLAQHGETVMRALVADLSWGIFGSEGLEGIASVRQLTEKSPDGAQIVYRRQVQIDLQYRSQWEPDTSGLTELETVGVRVNLDNGEDPVIGADIDVPTTP